LTREVQKVPPFANYFSAVRYRRFLTHREFYRSRQHRLSRKNFFGDEHMHPEYQIGYLLTREILEFIQLSGDAMALSATN
jgi:hypothetical protein